MSTQYIYYTQISSACVLGVYCNECNKLCDWGYSWPHFIIAYWTHDKDQILCPGCAKNPDNVSNVMRPVLKMKDLPRDRCVYRPNGSWNFPAKDNSYIWETEHCEKITQPPSCNCGWKDCKTDERKQHCE